MKTSEIQQMPAKPLTSRKRDCISTPPIYLDAVQVRPHYSTQSDINGKMPFTTTTSAIFSLPTFHQRLLTGTIYTRASVGTNGAFLERADQGAWSKVGSPNSNQLEPPEKDNLLHRCGPHQPWVLQVDQFCFQYARNFLGEIFTAFGNLQLRQSSLTACEYYAEVPLFDVSDRFDERFTKILKRHFGEADIERDRTTRKSYEDGDYRRWRVKTPNGLGKKVKTYVKCYEKGDVVRVEIRFENVPMMNMGLPGQAPSAVGLLEASLRTTLRHCGGTATPILEAIVTALKQSVPKLNIALLKKALKALGCRGVDHSKRYEILIRSLKNDGSYTPSRLTPGLALPYRTLLKLADPQGGILQRCIGLGGANPSRVSYLLRVDWIVLAKAAIQDAEMPSSKLSTGPLTIENSATQIISSTQRGLQSVDDKSIHAVEQKTAQPSIETNVVSLEKEDGMDSCIKEKFENG